MATGNPPGRSDDTPGGFLSRWSQRKTLVRQGVVPVEPVPVVLPPAGVPVLAQALATPAGSASDHPPLPAAPAAAPAAEPAAAPPAAPAPTLADVAALTPASDYSRFVAPGVDMGVKNAALKKLFTDPHFHIMDGLDTYIDDYGKPDPIPAGMLRQMVQSHALGLFSDEDDDDAPAPASTSPPAPPSTPAPADAAPALTPPNTAQPLQDTLPEPTATPDENPAL